MYIRNVNLKLEKRSRIPAGKGLFLRLIIVHMILIFFFPVLGALLGWLAHRLYIVLLHRQLRQQHKEIPPAIWDQYVAPVTGSLFGRLPFLGIILGFVLGLCFIVAIFLYYFIYLS